LRRFVAIVVGLAVWEEVGERWMNTSSLREIKPRVRLEMMV